MFKELSDLAPDNVADIATGLITGAALGIIALSLCDAIAMPLSSLPSRALGLPQWSINLSNPNIVPLSLVAMGVAVLNIGLFTNAVVKFLIAALVLCIVVRGVDRLNRNPRRAPLQLPTKDILS